MQNLIIIGARGYGRELYNYALECNEHGKVWVIKGFLDDKKDALDGFQGYPKIIGSVENYVPQPNDVFTCALGDVGFKKKYAQMIVEKGGEFINIIHPSVKIGRNTVLGKGCIVMPNAIISSEVKIGNFVTIQATVGIGHDVIIGEYCYVNSFAFLGGFVKMEDESTVFANACVLPKVTIGKNATVGAGSVVLKSVKPGVTVFGNPAKVIS